MRFKSAIKSAFFKYSVASVVATGIDFLIYVVLAKWMSVWYILAAIIGAISGGLTAYWLNRNWVFESTEEMVTTQLVKYVVVWFASMALNAAGLFLVVEYGHGDIVISKIIVSVVVGVGFNFFASKHFVF